MFFFPTVIIIFKLIYLLWFKMEHFFPRFGRVTRFTSASASSCFLSPFRGSCATWLRRSLHSKTLSTSHNLLRRKVEVTRWPKYSDKTANSDQLWIQEERRKQHSNHMVACTWPSNANLSRENVPTILELPTQAWNKAKRSSYTPLKTALSKRENHSINNAVGLVESRDAHRLGWSLATAAICASMGP